MGVSLSAGTPLPGGATLMSSALSGLAPASNYTVYLAVRQGAQLLDTVVALSGVLTPDNVPPTFAGVGGVGRWWAGGGGEGREGKGGQHVCCVCGRGFGWAPSAHMPWCREKPWRRWPGIPDQADGGAAADLMFVSLCVQVQNLTVDSQRFTMRLPVALSEAGNITFAIYRNASCINGEPYTRCTYEAAVALDASLPSPTASPVNLAWFGLIWAGICTPSPLPVGLDQVPVSTILSGAPLPASRCSCADPSACAPVVLGSAALSSDVLADTLTLSGLLPPNPYSALRGATEAQLTCRTGACGRALFLPNRPTPAQPYPVSHVCVLLHSSLLLTSTPPIHSFT